MPISTSRWEQISCVLRHLLTVHTHTHRILSRALRWAATASEPVWIISNCVQIQVANQTAFQTRSQGSTPTRRQHFYRILILSTHTLRIKCSLSVHSTDSQRKGAWYGILGDCTLTGSKFNPNITLGNVPFPEYVTKWVDAVAGARYWTPGGSRRLSRQCIKGKAKHIVALVCMCIWMVECGLYCKAHWLVDQTRKTVYTIHLPKYQHDSLFVHKAKCFYSLMSETSDVIPASYSVKPFHQKWHHKKSFSAFMSQKEWLLFVPFLIPTTEVSVWFCLPPKRKGFSRSKEIKVERYHKEQMIQLGENIPSLWKTLKGEI